MAKLNLCNRGEDGFGAFVPDRIGDEGDVVLQIPIEPLPPFGGVIPAMPEGVTVAGFEGEVFEALLFGLEDVFGGIAVPEGRGEEVSAGLQDGDILANQVPYCLRMGRCGRAGESYGVGCAKAECVVWCPSRRGGRSC